MAFGKAFWNWIDACRELTGYAEVPGYRELDWPARKKLDHLAVLRGLCSKGFRRACVIVLILGVLVQILCWELDLAGWRRDLLKCLPIAIAMPWMAAARKRHLRALCSTSSRPAGSG